MKKILVGFACGWMIYRFVKRVFANMDIILAWDDKDVFTSFSQDKKTSSKKKDVNGEEDEALLEKRAALLEEKTGDQFIDCPICNLPSVVVAVVYHQPDPLADDDYNQKSYILECVNDAHDQVVITTTTC